MSRTGYQHPLITTAVALLLLALPSVLAAQQNRIVGRVTGPDGQPVSGVAIEVTGTERGAFTDDDGRYTISLPPGEYTLEARAIGYRSMTRTVTLRSGATATVDFTLEQTAVQLGEIVASVEAGEVTRREMGVDIASVNVSEMLDASVVTNFSDLLNARAPNVTITQSSGNIGSGSRVRVRGINSLTQDNNPLLIIDGVRATNDTDVGINRGQTFSRFDDLDPSNIERVQVVKGPAATALYGSEAAAGVIIIETKSGRSSDDALEFTISHEQGAMWDVTEYSDNYSDVTPFVSGADDPRLDQWPVETNPVTGQVFVTDNPFEDDDTSPFRRGNSENTTVQVNGRASGISYFTSLRYEDRTGVLPSNDIGRTNFRANFRATPSDDITLIASSGYVNSETNLPKSGGNTSGFFANAQDGIPFAALGSQGDCLATVLAGTDPGFCDKNGNVRAAFDKITPITSRENLERFTGSLRVNYSPLDWLTNSAVLGVDVTSQTFTDAIPYDPEVPFSFAAGGENFITRNLRRQLTADVSSRASFSLTESITSRTAIGAQYFQTLDEMVACEGRVFVNDQATACDAAVSLRGFSDRLNNVETGVFVQQRFGYDNYLFATGAMRVDDNSSLGAEEPAIWSPSFNTSLVVNEMPFWNVDPDRISDFRVRAAWGKASQSPPQYAADRTYGIVRLGRGGTVVPGLSPEDPGNPNLGPERNTELEFGFDAGLLSDRIGLDFTYYRRSTTDAIVPRNVAPSSGFSNAQFVNLGELRNVGYETSIDARVLDRADVFWDVTFTMSSAKSEVIELGLEQPIFIGFSQVIAEGFAPGAYVSNVITHAERDADGNIIPGSVEYAPGNFGDDNLRVIGQPFPSNEQSLFSTVTLFDRLEISTLFERAAGHHLYSDGLEDRNPGSIGGINSAFGEMWAYRQTELTPVEQATIELDDQVGNHDMQWIRPANFIKWRELRLSYELPGEWSGRFGSSRAMLYVGGRNLMTFTGYPGLDPESNERGARDNLTVVEDNTLPPPRMMFSGIRISF